MATTLLHHILDDRVRVSPNARAITQLDECWTYSELRAASLSFANALVKVGVRAGDRVLVVAPHALRSAAAVFAASRLGAIYAVVSDALRPYVLGHVVHDCRPRVILVDGHPAGVAGVAGDVPVYRLDQLDQLDGNLGEPERRGGSPLDPVGLIYTSGSTAMPKAVVSTHAQVLFAARAIAGELGYRDDDVDLLLPAAVVRLRSLPDLPRLSGRLAPRHRPPWGCRPAAAAPARPSTPRRCCRPSRRWRRSCLR